MNDTAEISLTTVPPSRNVRAAGDDRDASFSRQLFNLISPYWRSEEKYIAWGLLALVVAANLATVYCLYRINLWNGSFYDALQKMDRTQLPSLVITFFSLVGLFIFVGVSGTYLNDYLTLRWRVWLTKQVMGDWLHNNTFSRLFTYHAKTENPDQRISSDLAIFTTSSLDLSVGIVSQLVKSVTFGALLWSLSRNLSMPLPGGNSLALPGYMLWLSIIYVIIATVIVFKTGKPLIGLDYKRERFEADFRFGLMRIRDRRDEVAILNGSKAEDHYLNNNIFTIIKNFKAIIYLNIYVNALQYFFLNATTILPMLVAAPAYFSGLITLGVLVQMSSAFSSVNQSLGVFAQQYQSLASWKATFNRIVDFRAQMADLKNKVTTENHDLQIITGPQQNVLKVEDLRIHLPNNSALITFNLEVQPGEHVLLMGRSGLGKTTLLKTIAGQWPYASGKIYRPQDMIIIPQKPYSPIAKLRDAILYPNITMNIADSELNAVLTLCCLEKLMHRLDEEADWTAILSLGEQQRLNFARLIIAKPNWAILDEPTASMDKALESKMFEVLFTALPQLSLLTIGHAPSLKELHTRCIILDNH